MDKARNILFLFILALVVFSCKEEDVKSIVNADPEKVPTVTSHDVKTLISDSGITKYRITAKVWYIFEEAKKPFWLFPDGLFLEEFDSIFKVKASIQCDSAKYFKDDQIWRLDGNVRIWNVNKELILTNQMFWSQREQKVYSDSFIHIEKEDRVIEGYGFKSNEKMTTYSINKVSGIFPVSEQRQSTKRQTVPANGGSVAAQASSATQAASNSR